MLPRLRFVIASIAIAILPMVFLGSGAVPAPPASAAFTAAAPNSARPIRTLPREPRVVSETQYRYERHAMSFARRSEELSRLRELASLSLSDWAAAPAGPAEPPAANEAVVPPAAGNPPAIDRSAAATPSVAAPAVALPVAAAPPVPALAPDHVGTAATVAAATEAAAPSASQPPAVVTTPAQPVAANVPPPAEDASGSNKPAAEKATADNPPAPAAYAALTLDNDVKTTDAPKIEAGASPLTQVVVVASRAKPKKARRAAHRRGPARAVARPRQQPAPPAGPFAFFSWLFGQQPGQPQSAQTQNPAQTLPQAHIAVPSGPFSPPAAPKARTTARTTAQTAAR